MGTVCSCIVKEKQVTHTQKLSPNTGVRANNTLHKVLGYPVGEPARQSACKARPQARYAPLAAYAAPVVEDVHTYILVDRVKG